MLNIGKWFGYNYESKVATPIMSQDDLRTQLRNPNERKPDGYKNINTSALRFPPITNLNRNLTPI